MLPCCARVCLVEVSWRPAECSGQVWLKDKRLTGSRLFWSAKLKDKDKGIKDVKVEKKRTGTKRLARHLSFILKPVEWIGDFRPIHSELVFTLLQVKGSQEFAFLSFMCCVDLEKAYHCVSSGVLWEMLLEYGVQGITCESFDTWSKACFYSWHQVAIGLRQGCSLASLPFVIFIDSSL